MVVNGEQNRFDYFEWFFLGWKTISDIFFYYPFTNFWFNYIIFFRWRFNVFVIFFIFMFIIQIFCTTISITRIIIRFTCLIISTTSVVFLILIWWWYFYILCFFINATIHFWFFTWVVWFLITIIPCDRNLWDFFNPCEGYDLCLEIQ